MKFKHHWQLTIVCIVFLLSAITYFTYQTSYKRLEQESLSALQTRTQSKASLFLAKISEVTSNLKFMQSVPPIQGIIRATKNNGIDPLDQSALPEWKKRLGEIFKSYVLSHNDIYQIRYIGLGDGGRELVRVDRTLSGAQITPESKLQEKGDRDYFKEITSSDFDGVFISDITLNREYGKIQIPHNPTIRLAVKAYTDKGDLFGFIIVNKSVSPLFHSLAYDLPKSMNMYILNDHGQFLYHPDPKVAFNFELGGDLTWARYTDEENKKTIADNKSLSISPKDAILASVDIPLMKGKNAITIKLLASKKPIRLNAITNTVYAFLIFIVSLGIFLVIFSLYRRSIKTQTALVLEKARNSSIVEGSQDAIIAVSMDGKITDWNPGANQMFGYSKKEVLGEHIHNIVHTRDNVQEESRIRQALSLGGRIKPFESVRRTKSGKLIHVSVSASPIQNESGDVIGVSKIIRDITEQKQIADKLEELNHTLEQQVEERTSELQESHNLQTAILENAAHIVIATDVKGVITLFNPAAEVYLGYSADEIVGKETPKLFHLESDVIQRSTDFSEELAEEIAPGFEVFVAKSNKGIKNEHEWTYVTKSGNKLPVYLSVTSLYNNKGEINGYLGMATDITEIVNHKNKLEVLKDQLTKASEVANIGIWSWNTSTNIITWNPIMFDIYDVEQDSEVDFYQWTRMVVDEDRDRAVEHFRRFAEEGSGTAIIFDILTPKGRRKTIHATATVETNLFDSVVSMIGVNKDISEQVRYEQALKAAKEESDQANQTKSEFVANMSHEIRTPMSAIIGLLELLRRTELNSKQLDYVAKSDSAAKSLLHILNDILDFSKVEAGKLEIDPHPFCLSDLVENVTTVLATNIKDKDVELIIDLDPILPSYVTLDSLRLQQIIVNLASNAIKFTHEGIVSVKLICDTADFNTLIIVVSDTGIGIPKDKQEKIFEAFSQAESSTVRQYGGTGLGLVISRKLIELMGGSLSLESEVNVGTTFTIKVPYSDSHLKKSFNMVHKNLNVLVVDDRDESLEAIKHVVDSIGWQVTLASGGVEAITQVQNSVALNKPFDLILMDWKMPEMNGWETILRIKALGDKVFAGKVFVVTAYGDSSDIKDSHNEQKVIDAIINKPLTASLLVDRYLDVASSDLVVSPAFVSKEILLQGVKVLLAEDNAINQLVAKEILEAEGASVTIASNGLEAVELLQNNDSGTFDIILMDIQMPVMDGYTAAREIRDGQASSLIPIIAMTANALLSDKKAAFEAGMNAHVSKPFDVEVLIKQISVLLSLSGSSIGKDSGGVLENKVNQADGLDIAAKAILNADEALKRLGNNQGLLNKALSGYLQTAPSLWTQITDHADASKNEEISALAHTFKGVASTIGADCLAEKLQILEASSKAGQCLNYDQSLNEIDQICQRTNEEIESYLRHYEMPILPTKRVDMLDTEFLFKLNELNSLLEESNMRAIDLFNELNAQSSSRHDSLLSQIEGYMNQLDFAAAAEIVKDYLKDN